MPPPKAPPTDPIDAEYTVHIAPAPAPAVHSHLYLLQHPTRNRKRPYSAAADTQPCAARIKPQSGFLEVDVPVERKVNFDEGKARRWGQALRGAWGGGVGGENKVVGGGGQSGFGMANGFVGPRGGLAVGAGKEEGEGKEEEEEDVEMDRQTLGGKVVRGGGAGYMLGAFRGDELHLTPLTGLAQLRPQFHHLDAESYVARNAATATARSSAAGAPQSNDPMPGTGAGQATAAPRPVYFNHTRQSALPDLLANDGGGDRTLENDTRELLGRAAGERWVQCRYWDEEDPVAYERYQRRLFGGGGGGEKSGEELVASWSKGKYLDTISRGRGARRRESGSPQRRKSKAKGQGNERSRARDGHA